MAGSIWTDLEAELDRSAAAGQRIELWLRDDDAVAMTEPLARLMALSGEWGVPVVLAVVPSAAQPGLAGHVRKLAHVRAVVHGFAHANHAPEGEKKQELGLHRPAAAVLEDLASGLARIEALFGDYAEPMLVPPWNRIAAELVPHLPRLGFRSLSAFGAAPARHPVAGLVQVHCQLDIIDWRGSRGCLPHDVLAQRLAGLVRQSRDGEIGPIGILTHHLMHDEAAWRFLAELFRLTAGHPAAAWAWPYAGFTGQPAKA